MKRFIQSIGIGVTLMTLSATVAEAQETYFGKNKVNYRRFGWEYIQSDHFDIYFYDSAFHVAKFTAETLEEAYDSVTAELKYHLQSRVPVFVYLSPNEFQQTNITSEILPEAVGGFTEAFKKRIVIPYNGSYEDLRHVLHHELTHAVIYDLLYGNVFTSLLSRQRLFDLPLWFAEGYAEYSSRYGWDYWADMVVRDATINNYLAPPDYLNNYLAYKQGQAMLNFFVEKYGEEKLGLLLRKGKTHLTMNRAFKAATGVELDKYWEEFSLEMKRRYWPEIARRKKVEEISKQLTHHGKDQSFLNQKPAFSPKGDAIAIFSDRNDFTEIFLISPVDGKVIRKLTKASRSGDLESLHSYLSGVTFAPDGERLAFVAKSNGSDALFVMRVRDRKILQRRRLGFNLALTPSWSPDNSRIALVGARDGKRDLYIYHITPDTVERVTTDANDDRDPVWTPDGAALIFSSDRPHPDNSRLADSRSDRTGLSADSTLAFAYGAYNLFRITLADRAITPLAVGPGQNKEPAVSPDGRKVVFVSNRNGIDNLYLSYLDSTGAVAITDVLTGVESPSWAPNGREIAFSSFHTGGYDVFLLKELLPAGKNGVLEPTDFWAGKYEPASPQFATCKVSGDESAEADSSVTSKESDPAADLARRITQDADTTALVSLDTSGFTTSGDFAQVSPADSVAQTPKSDTLDTADSSAALDSLLTDFPENDRGALRRTLPADLRPQNNRNEFGEYVIRPYKTKFTPDYVSGGFNYDTFFGLRGRSFFVLSDYLGQNQFYLVTDIVNTIDQSNLQVFYFNSAHRTRLGGGMFHTKNFYLDNNNFLFSDRFYGAQFFADRPFSTYSRLEGGASLTFIDRRYYDFGDTRTDRSTKATILNGAWVRDNVLWGYTGPYTGQRSKLSFTVGEDFFSEKTATQTPLSFWSAELDHRRYWHIYRRFSAAFRGAGGYSGGATPKRYYVGGSTNWIGTRVVDPDVYNVENLYFSDIVTPLRGLDRYDNSGTRYALANVEFRYPFIDYLKIGFPLPITLSNLIGVAFLDMGATWDDKNLRFATNQGGFRLVDGRAGFGWGARVNLGFFLLRYDMAWGTDLNSVPDKPKHYFSLGADF